jgi:hypothetical protein
VCNVERTVQEKEDAVVVVETLGSKNHGEDQKEGKEKSQEKVQEEERKENQEEFQEGVQEGDLVDSVNVPEKLLEKTFEALLEVALQRHQPGLVAISSLGTPGPESLLCDTRRLAQQHWNTADRHMIPGRWLVFGRLVGLKAPTSFGS